MSQLNSSSGIILNDGFNIDSFRSKVKNVARTNLFYVQVPLPNDINSNIGDASYFTFLAQGTDLPGRTISELTVNWQGYDYKIGGGTTWSDWKVTFILDSEYSGYNAMKSWADKVHNPLTNEYGNPGTGSDGYVTDSIRVQQLSLDGKKPVAEVKLIGAWPKDISPITLKYESNSQAPTFDVTFAFVYAIDVKV